MLTKMCFCCFDNKDKGNNAKATDTSNPVIVLPIHVQPKPLKGVKMFAEVCLEEHNRLRALHGCPALRWSKSLSAYATEWAAILAERNTLLEYRNEGRYGENIYVARDYEVDARTVVQSWYDGMSLYSFENPGYVYGVDPFAQVIWKDTKEMGVGVRMSGGNKWIVVNYAPKGNTVGKYQENVPRLLK